MTDSQEQKDTNDMKDQTESTQQNFDKNIDKEETTEEFVDHESENTETTDFKDKFLRSLAEIENMRRRSDKQAEEARDYAVFSFARDLVEMMDNFEKAMYYKPSDTDDVVKNFSVGIEMTYEAMKKVFVKHGIIKISPNLNDIFSYEMHQAILHEESNEFEANRISKVIQDGYKIKSRLIRPAIVIVSKGSKV